MKLIDMSKGDTTQFYILPTIIVSKTRLINRVFIAWLYWSVEL